MSATTTPGRTAKYGFAKNTGGAAGASNPPSDTNGIWIPWQDGCTLGPDAAMQQLWVGDGSRGQAINVKTRQNAVGTYVLLPRAYELAALFAAISGPGSDAVTTNTHVITPVLAGNNSFYTLAMNLGSAYNMLCNDMVLHRLELTASVTAPVLRATATWGGISSVMGTTPDATSFRTEGWMYYFSGATHWVLPGGLHGTNAEAAIRSFTFIADLGYTPENFQAESITTLPVTPDNLTLSGTFEVLWQDGGITAQTYFGGSAGTTDNALAPSGDFEMQFACSSDATQTFKIAVPACSFTGAPMTVNLNGPVTQTVNWNGLRYVNTGTSNAVVVPYTVTAVLDSSATTAFE